MKQPKVGEMFKVNLRGETPWAEILEMHDDGFTGRIANVTFAQRSEFERAQFCKQVFDKGGALPKLHDFKQDDIVRFKAVDDRGYIILVPESDLPFYLGEEK